MALLKKLNSTLLTVADNMEFEPVSLISNLENIAASMRMNREYKSHLPSYAIHVQHCRRLLNRVDGYCSMNNIPQHDLNLIEYFSGIIRDIIGYDAPEAPERLLR